MPRVNLTQKIVEATPLPLGRKSVDYFDRRMPGLVLRVSAGGTKSWNAVYRHHGRARRLTLGRYPIIALDDARNRAAKRCAPCHVGSTLPTARRRRLPNSHPSLSRAMCASYVVRVRSSG